MKPIRKMRLFAAALAVACLLAATVRTVAAGRGKAVLTGVVYGDGAPLAGVCVSDGVQFATTDAAGRYRIESDKSAGFVFAVTPSNWVAAEADGVQPLFWAALDEADAREMLEDAGLSESGLDQLARVGFDILGLQTFLTAGVKEVRAWQIHKGWTAPQAAGVIHTDFEKGFIKADIVSYDDFVAADGSMAKIKEEGKLRQEGRDYVMADGDIVEFKFNVSK